MTEENSEHVSLKEMTRKQRRVIGVLLEKAFTVPDQYPLTLKSATTGCNQKNNRDPISSYDEDDVQETLSALQERGLVGCIHTEGGRTERYRHYMRHKTPLNEQQLAIVTELLLRGKQQLGELRTRASRMVAIDTQEDLRRELQALINMGYVRASGPLERRGIEVDHDFYPMGENHEPLAEAPFSDSESGEGSEPASERQTRSATTAISHQSAERIGQLESTVQELKSELSSIRSDFSALQDRFEELRRQLGG